MSDFKFSPPFTMGTDSGSLTAKAVIMDSEKRIVANAVVQMGFVSQKALDIAIDTVLTEAGMKLDDMAYIVSTGYGRRRLKCSNKSVTEISCHAKGAHFLNPDVKTVIDIGGQDSKVIAVDHQGNASNFAMNDRCAAGTGKFLEVMAKALEVDLEKTGEMALQYTNKLEISSVCAVFAETEVISLVAQGNSIPDILAGLHEAIASRILGMVSRVGQRQPVMMTGGVAKNIGVVKALEKAMGVSIIVPPQCQIVGAIGAALFAAAAVPAPD